MDMYRYLHDEIIKGTAIDYLEFGVYQGESIKFWTSINKASQSRFFGFDSFEGLPEDWRDGQPRGHFDTRGSTPIIDDGRVRFCQGLVHQLRYPRLLGTLLRGTDSFSISMPTSMVQRCCHSFISIGS